MPTDDDDASAVFVETPCRPHWASDRRTGSGASSSARRVRRTRASRASRAGGDGQWPSRPKRSQPRRCSALLQIYDDAPPPCGGPRRRETVSLASRSIKAATGLSGPTPCWLVGAPLVVARPRDPLLYSRSKATGTPGNCTYCTRRSPLVSHSAHPPTEEAAGALLGRHRRRRPRTRPTTRWTRHRHPEEKLHYWNVRRRARVVVVVVEDGPSKKKKKKRTSVIFCSGRGARSR
mmetsp:Transcript_4060/g.16345  ORF Transcript_4060/g.16345 Transcript_4060/m.16345 type:complete len:234 (+) Transcript_4060:198-899(+)